MAVAAALLLGGGGAVFGQETAPDIRHLAGAAKFVVHSRVSKVEYRMSAAGEKGQPPVPFTIVTYDVIRSVRGAASSGSFSLRYIGGPDGRGHFLRASNVPVFQAGDEDILFVQNNGANGGCPLVGCIEGRFRVLNGALYDGTGTPVQAIDANNKVVARGKPPAEFGKVSYPAPAFDELLKNPEVRDIINKRGMSVDEARRQYEAQGPATVEMTAGAGGAMGGDSAGYSGRQSAAEGAPPQQEARPMSVDRFVAAVKAVPATAGTAESGFQSADPNAQIAAPAPRPVPPPSASERSIVTPRSPADVAEERALPKDDPTSTRNKSR
ncbi:hypothetical protein [Azohydromonas caseinilytica]|uniref:Uncharacterized protein n=1 Tax=Azohydromonas caseinilytica TaxID=2728836 RepID=A0A848FIT3_9BURK|nr:hypothetical protein [Azohydromonas caseinilytica]NML18100.1 hypothetical protein [Azohydromonas caseinilytica]